MDESAFKDYYENRFKKSIEQYNSKSALYKRWYVRIQILIVVFAAVTPVLALLEFKILTAISASIIAVATGEDNQQAFKRIGEMKNKLFNIFMLTH